MHLKLILFVLTNILFSSCNIQMLEFYTPGTYNITNLDYSKSENIIIEIWGAGSGASAGFDLKCYGFDCNEQKLLSVFYGGNSGAYIKANIITNQNTFTLVIGEGGKSFPAYQNGYYPNEGTGYPGGQTSFSNMNLTTNLIAQGGNAPDDNGWYVQPAVPVSLVVDGYIMSSFNGFIGLVEYQEEKATGANGAPAPCGSQGGSSSNYDNITPGGGAYSTNFVTYGGNGGAIIYFSSVFTSTASPTPSPTQSISSTSTPSKSITKSASFTGTSSSSASLSPSGSLSPTSSVSQSAAIMSNIEIGIFAVICLLFIVCCFSIIILWIIMFIVYKLGRENEYQAVIN